MEQRGAEEEEASQHSGAAESTEGAREGHEGNSKLAKAER